MSSRFYFSYRYPEGPLGVGPMFQPVYQFPPVLYHLPPESPQYIPGSDSGAVKRHECRAGRPGTPGPLGPFGALGTSFSFLLWLWDVINSFIPVWEEPLSTERKLCTRQRYSLDYVVHTVSWDESRMSWLTWDTSIHELCVSLTRPFRSKTRTVEPGVNISRERTHFLCRGHHSTRTRVWDRVRKVQDTYWSGLSRLIHQFLQRNTFWVVLWVVYGPLMLRNILLLKIDVKRPVVVLCRVYRK